jgi:hypothetical protein
LLKSLGKELFIKDGFLISIIAVCLLLTRTAGSLFDVSVLQETNSEIIMEMKARYLSI